jgi:hypothetical protein
LPFLRFARDKRGYETTSLVYAGRRQGRSRPRILYWFRTPPGVKVGRAALDEYARRWIEEQNPDITFDWRRILDAKAPPAPPPEDARFRRGRRTPERRSTPRPTVAQPPVPPEAEELPPDVEIPEITAADPVTNFVRGPDPEPPSDRDQRMRLRARYADMLVRITERGGDAERIAARHTQAEALNPDAWATAEDIRTGVEAFERRIQDLRAALGLHRRRRSRRGGRRRRGESGGGTPAETPSDPSKESPD